MNIQAIFPYRPRFVRCGEVVIDTTKASENTVFKGHFPDYVDVSSTSKYEGPLPPKDAGNKLDIKA